jgi:hypothetical protein
MKFNITLTWSKLVAVLILGCATALDIKLATSGSLFMFSLPFVAALILGKQGKELLSELKKK